MTWLSARLGVVIRGHGLLPVCVMLVNHLYVLLDSFAPIDL